MKSFFNIQIVPVCCLACPKSFKLKYTTQRIVYASNKVSHIDKTYFVQII